MSLRENSALAGRHREGLPGRAAGAAREIAGGGRRRRLRAAWALCLGLLWAGAASAASHALLILVADYPPFGLRNVPNDLPGVARDAALAEAIAARFGVPAGNRVVLLNRDANRARVLAELDALTRRAGRADHVLVYFSGHGYRAAGADGQCEESLVTADADDAMLLAEPVVRARLGVLAERAAQVVVLLDACHSGGIGATRALARPLPPGVTAKAYAPPGRAAPDCRAVSNPDGGAGLFRSLGRERNNLTLLAAARRDELARADAEGSYATRAWLACLANTRADRNHSGGIDAEEFLACAQDEVDRATAAAGVPPQHLALHGNAGAAMSFAAPAAPVAAEATAPGVPVAAGSPGAAVADLYAARDPNWAVSLTTDRARYRIGQERVRMTARSARDGYLYVFMHGSSQRCAYLLFPNARDGENRLAAGQSLALDESRGWAFWPGGPAGTDTLTAIVTPHPLDLGAVGLLPEGPFQCADGTGDSLARLQRSFAETAGGRQALGAARVRVEETP